MKSEEKNWEAVQEILIDYCIENNMSPGKITNLTSGQRKRLKKSYQRAMNMVLGDRLKVPGSMMPRCRSTSVDNIKDRTRGRNRKERRGA